MKKIIILLSINFLFFLNASEIKKAEVNPNKFVIMLGSYVEINDAQRFAQKFEHEEIYIFKDKNLYTVRIVNINSKKQAQKILKYIKRRVPDAILWKKMNFLNKSKFNKLHSEIYTVQPDIVEAYL
jgi:copper homeostasis protein CutC